MSIIEVLVAALIVVVGLLGTVAMADMAHHQTTTSKAREQGVSLQREIVEGARSIPYEELLPGSTNERVEAMPGLADQDAASGGWTIRRRGVTYTVSLGVCTVDDPSDGTGPHDSSTFCPQLDGSRTSPQRCRDLIAQLHADVAAGGSGTSLSGATPREIGECGLDLSLDGRVDNLLEAELGLCLLGSCPTSTPPDPNPDDYKWIIALVRWDRGDGHRFALQSSLVPNPGLASGITIRSLTDPAQVTSGTSVPFSVTTSRSAAAVSWAVDGRMQGSATGSETAWDFAWSLTDVVDGAYLISARATDSAGISGTPRSVTVRVNRSAPVAPRNFAAGRNGSVVELEWTRNPEGDIETYRAFRVGASGDVQVCETRQTACQDPSPPASAADYYVRAVDRDPAGALRLGDASVVRTVGTTNNPPFPPTGLSASTSAGNTILYWTAPDPADPDAGDAIDFYRIYRDGKTYADRYGRTGSGAERTFTDTRTDGLEHTYWVTAVDRNLAESVVAGPVTR